MKRMRVFRSRFLVVAVLALLFASLPGSAADLDAVLFKAAEEGDISRARQMIAAGANVNVANEKGVTALSLAVAGGHAELARMLLEKGASEKPDGSLLGLATLKNDLPMVRVLVANGIAVNVHFPMEGEWKAWTPLMFAANFAAPEVVEILLRNGARVNAKADIGITALHIASVNNRKEIVKMLLAHGSDPNERDITGKTPLDYVRAMGYKEIVELLEQRIQGTTK